MSRYSVEQQAIIEHQAGHAKVEAVAGSGKTHALVGRVMHLLEQGVLPEQILVIMYGRDPCNDFAIRLKALTPHRQTLPAIKTFHSIMGRHVYDLTEGDQFGGMMPVWPLLIDNEATFTQFQLCQEALKIVGVEAEEDNIRDIALLVAKVKADFDIANDPIAKLSEKDKALFSAYEKLRARRKVRFFDDLFYDFWHCLMDNAGLTQLFRSRIQHIIVDEYQDINRTQQCLLRMLYNNTRDASVMVVGDVNQTIYEFRGSKPCIMLKEFAKEFPKATTYQLSQTFRFGRTIANLSNHFIAHNKTKVDMVCIANNNVEDSHVEIIAPDDFSMVQLLVTLKKKKIATTAKKLAVLVREYHHAYGIEAECIARNIDYTIIPSKSFLSSSPVQSILSYLRLADAGRYFKRLERKVRLACVQRMLSCPRLYVKSQYRTELANTLANDCLALTEFDRIAALIDKEKVAKSVLARRQGWDAALSVWGEDNAEMTLLTLRQKLRYATYFDYSSPNADDARRKMAAINALIALAKNQQSTVTEFLTYIDALLQEDENTVPKRTNPRFAIHTIHSAKGLEWDSVIIPQLQTDGFPSVEAIEKGQLEAERRLFYVAMTRAKKNLYFIGYPHGHEKVSQFIQECGIP